MNKVSGGDGIPVELFQILKDDSVKVLHSICQQIWKTQQWPQGWESSVFIPIPKKGNAKECSNYRTIALISHASKVMRKILKPGFNNMWTMYFQMFKLDLEMAEEPEIKLPTFVGSQRKQANSRKMSASLTVLKSLTVCITINWKILNKMGMPDHLTCLLGNLPAGQEATVRTGHGTMDRFKIGKGVCRGYTLSPCLFNLYAEHIMWNAGLGESQAGIKTAGRNINNLRHADTTLIIESKEPLDESERAQWKSGLKFNIQKLKIMASSPIISWKIDGETVETVRDFIFLGSKITADRDCSHEIKRHLLLGRKAMTNLDSILKSRDITLLTKVCIAKAMVFPVIIMNVKVGA